MRSFPKQKNSGFTLIELLVVIAIIGVLATVVLASLNASRVKARNADVLSQMYEYQKALDLYYAANGSYPASFSNPNNTVNFRRRIYCIGDEFTGSGSGNRCMNIAEDNNVTSHIETVLVPNFIGRIRHINQGTKSSPAYRGCSDLCQLGSNVCNTDSNINFCTNQDYSLFFVLEGTEQGCGRGNVVNENLGGDGYTLCQLWKSEYR